jgi:hypothetical protein
MKHVRIYRLLKANGHSPTKAAEILLDATRGDGWAKSCSPVSTPGIEGGARPSWFLAGLALTPAKLAQRSSLMRSRIKLIKFRTCFIMNL